MKTKKKKPFPFKREYNEDAATLRAVSVAGGRPRPEPTALRSWPRALPVEGREMGEGAPPGLEITSMKGGGRRDT